MKFYYLIGQLLRPFATVAFIIYSHVFRTPRARLVLRNEKGQILLVQSWLSGDAWGLPGGGMHRGEDAAAAACRELEEETGIALHERELTSLFTLKSSGHAEIVFLATIKKDDLPSHPIRKFEIKEAGWFPLESVPKLEPAAAKVVGKIAL